jgi:hypothetical protein
MYPSEMKNRAIVAAATAAQEGFTATAEALLRLAEACAKEARDIDVARHPKVSPAHDGARENESLLLDIVG